MSRVWTVTTVLLVVIGCATRTKGVLVDIGGHRLRLHVEGNGSPVVVFDSGMGDPLEVWDRVRPEVAKFTSVCVYDRAGLGRSDPGPGPRTSHRIAHELRALLSNAGVEGPYVLVGHSFGGLNMLTFATEYPEDVVGLVLIDPTPPDYPGREESLLSPADRVALESAIESAPPALRMELEALEDSAAQVRGIAVDPALEVVVLSAKGRGQTPVFRDEWMLMQVDFANRIGASKHVFAEYSGHYIQFDEPQLVVESIRDIVELSGR